LERKLEQARQYLPDGYITEAQFGEMRAAIEAARVAAREASNSTTTRLEASA
jgi:hypothetical protein